MNNEKYNQIIDDVYKTYWNSVATSEYDPFGPISIKCNNNQVNHLYPIKNYGN